MKFGLHLGTRGTGADPDSLLTIARKAETVGFHHLGISDHVVVATTIDSTYPYTATGEWFAQDTGVCLEQVTTLAFVAAGTKRIRLLNSVMVLPHRPAILAAKMLATVDILSKGRLTVGVGVGWMEEELALLGAPPFGDRGRASDEYIEAFRVLWTAARPRYSGRHVAFDNLLFAPKPVQRPHPPIWIGGEGPAARRRAGRLGDGWYPVNNNPKAPLDTADRYAAGLSDVRRAAETAGRDPAAVEAALFAIGFRLDEFGGERQSDRRPFTGNAAAIVDDIGAYRDLGLRHLVIGFESDDLGKSIDIIDRFSTEVLPHFA